MDFIDLRLPQMETAGICPQDKVSTLDVFIDRFYRRFKIDHAASKRHLRDVSLANRNRSTSKEVRDFETLTGERVRRNNEECETLFDVVEKFSAPFCNDLETFHRWFETYKNVTLMLRRGLLEEYVPPKEEINSKRNIEFHLIDAGHVIFVNELIFVSKDAYNFIAIDSSGMKYCVLCKCSLPSARECYNHINSHKHIDKISLCVYLSKYNLDFIRRIEKSCVHCAVCNKTMSESWLSTEHFKSEDHVSAWKDATDKAGKFVHAVQCSRYHLLAYAPDCDVADHLLLLQLNGIHIRPRTKHAICKKCNLQFAYVNWSCIEQHISTVKHHYKNVRVPYLTTFDHLVFYSIYYGESLDRARRSVVRLMANKNIFNADVCQICGVDFRYLNDSRAWLEHLLGSEHSCNCQRLEAVFKDGYPLVFVQEKSKFFCNKCQTFINLTVGVEVLNHLQSHVNTCYVEVRPAIDDTAENTAENVQVTAGYEENNKLDDKVKECEKVPCRGNGAVAYNILIERIIKQNHCVICEVDLVHTSQTSQNHIASPKHKILCAKFTKVMIQNKEIVLDQSYSLLYCVVCDLEVVPSIDGLIGHVDDNLHKKNKLKTSSKLSKNNNESICLNTNFVSKEPVPYCICCDISLENQARHYHTGTEEHIRLSKLLVSFLNNERIHVYTHLKSKFGFCELCNVKEICGSFKEFSNHSADLYHQKINNLLRSNNREAIECKFCRKKIPLQLEDVKFYTCNHKPKLTLNEIGSKPIDYSWKEDKRDKYYIDVPTKNHAIISDVIGSTLEEYKNPLDIILGLAEKPNSIIASQNMISIDAKKKKCSTDTISELKQYNYNKLNKNVNEAILALDDDSTLITVSDLDCHDQSKNKAEIQASPSVATINKVNIKENKQMNLKKPYSDCSIESIDSLEYRSENYEQYDVNNKQNNTAILSVVNSAYKTKTEVNSHSDIDAAQMQCNDELLEHLNSDSYLCNPIKSKPLFPEKKKSTLPDSSPNLQGIATSNKGLTNAKIKASHSTQYNMNSKENNTVNTSTLSDVHSANKTKVNFRSDIDATIENDPNLILDSVTRKVHCRLCDIKVDYLNTLSHTNGKKHDLNLKSQANNKAVEKVVNDFVNANKLLYRMNKETCGIHCNVCKIEFAPDELQEHLKSYTHLSNAIKLKSLFSEKKESPLPDSSSNSQGLASISNGITNAKIKASHSTQNNMNIKETVNTSTLSDVNSANESKVTSHCDINATQMQCNDELLENVNSDSHLCNAIKLKPLFPEKKKSTLPDSSSNSQGLATDVDTFLKAYEFMKSDPNGSAVYCEICELKVPKILSNLQGHLCGELHQLALRKHKLKTTFK